MDYIIGLIAFVFVLGVIVLVHEGGHFFFARRVNILCREYAFGMGPQLLKKRKGETVYSLRAFPIGGFCAIAGEEVEDDPLKGLKEVKLDIKNNKVVGFYLDVEKNDIDYPIYEIVKYDIFDERETGNLYIEVIKDGQNITLDVDPKAFIYQGKLEYQIAPYNRTINSKSKRARAMVIFGGPLMNFILALLVFFMAGLIQGFPNEKSSEIADITEDTPAYVATLQNGDVITKLSSSGIERNVTIWDDISLFMSSYQALGTLEEIEVTYIRDGKEYKTNLTPAVYIYNAGFASDYTINNKVVISSVANYDNNLANSTEIKEKDEIIMIEGKEVSTWGDVYKVFGSYIGESKVEEENWINMTVLRDGKEVEVKVKPFSKTVMETQTTTSGDKIPSVKVAMGISPTYKFSLLKSFSYSGRRTLESFTAIVDTFKLLFGGDVGVENLSGPVGIFSLTKDVAKEGFSALLNLIGLLSVNIGLLNLLPIPALDGGRLVFIAYEAITKKKPNQKVETALITVTLLLLFGLMIYVTFGDILRLLGIRG